MSAPEAITMLQKLSPERASKVFSLIEDLAQLEALEDAEDLQEARESLAEVAAESATVPYEQLRREAGLDR
jgi:hypothetical protein